MVPWAPHTEAMRSADLTAFGQGGGSVEVDETFIGTDKEYVCMPGRSIHTSTVEGFFSISKRGMKGVYQHCAKEHLHRHLAEFVFRYTGVPSSASMMCGVPTNCLKAS